VRVRNWMFGDWKLVIVIRKEKLEKRKESVEGQKEKIKF